jgi:hypothetical protein
LKPKVPEIKPVHNISDVLKNKATFIRKWKSLPNSEGKQIPSIYVIDPINLKQDNYIQYLI